MLVNHNPRLLEFDAGGLTSLCTASQPVCTTEIGRLALKYKELSAKGVKLATLSCDPVTDHQKWLDDVVAHCENKARSLAALHLQPASLLTAQRSICAHNGVLPAFACACRVVEVLACVLTANNHFQ